MFHLRHRVLRNFDWLHSLHRPDSKCLSTRFRNGIDSTGLLLVCDQHLQYGLQLSMPFLSDWNGGSVSRLGLLCGVPLFDRFIHNHRHISGLQTLPRWNLRHSVRSRLVVHLVPVGDFLFSDWQQLSVLFMRSGHLRRCFRGLELHLLSRRHVHREQWIQLLQWLPSRQGLLVNRSCVFRHMQHMSCGNIFLESCIRLYSLLARILQSQRRQFQLHELSRGDL